MANVTLHVFYHNKKLIFLNSTQDLVRGRGHRGEERQIWEEKAEQLPELIQDWEQFLSTPARKQETSKYIEHQIESSEILNNRTKLALD